MDEGMKRVRTGAGKRQKIRRSESYIWVFIAGREPPNRELCGKNDKHWHFMQ